MLDVNDVLLTIAPCHRHNSHMTLYNSLSATHRVLPHQLTDTAEGAARYACGPTVCDAAHLGPRSNVRRVRHFTNVCRGRRTTPQRTRRERFLS